ncbi:probable protein S-acyltransferase 15 isoform X2 [Ziziphus jujuba]|uniref:S-acyltransferase n=1 Tax=Ziziphus jujuba TaxID=326968 RepID=A0A6P3ZUT9_ZIZJJ|nr:probable protein S-acyltransferase 15 isoform X2 [Ziziphus jujuba]
MKCKRFLSISILGVFLLIGFVYYTTVFIFIEDWVGLQSSAGSLNVIIFTFLVSLCFFSFFVCVLTDPGHVPDSYVPDIEESGVPDEERRKNDHHCIWINNCVGYWNYKAFFTLVLYATIGSIYSTVMIVACSIQKDWEFSERVSFKIFYVTSGVMMVALSLTLGTLLGWHIYLIIHNMTTIEYYEGVRAAWLARKSGQSYRHPFDHGVYKNITLVLGPNMLKWLCPTALSHLKDGLNFPTSRDRL